MKSIDWGALAIAIAFISMASCTAVGEYARAKYANKCECKQSEGER